MKRIACAAAMLAAVFVTPAVAADHTMMLGDHYNVVGTNADGSPYRGTADVHVISTTTFLVAWHIKGAASSGFGMRMGDTISATYMLDGAPGLIIYRQTANGGFKGIWAIKGQNGSGTEEWTPQ